MAKGRMLNKKISLDDKVNRLSCDTARLLFTWLIAHLDGAGCFYGDPLRVKNLVFPMKNGVKISRCERFLQEMASNELISFYYVDGLRYIYFPNFKKNQPGLRQEREASSDIPPPPEMTDLLRQNDGFTPTKIRQDVDKNPAEKNRSRKEVEDNTPFPNGNGLMPNGIAPSKQVIPPKKRGATPKEPDPLHPEVKLVFEGLFARRKFQSPAAAAEASAIRWMLKQGYPSGEQLACYDYLKSQPFWADKPVLMSSVKMQIGEWKKNGKAERAIEGSSSRGTPSAIPGQRPGGAFDDID